MPIFDSGTMGPPREVENRAPGESYVQVVLLERVMMPAIGPLKIRQREGNDLFDSILIDRCIMYFPNRDIFRSTQQKNIL